MFKMVLILSLSMIIGCDILSGDTDSPSPEASSGDVSTDPPIIEPPADTGQPPANPAPSQAPQLSSPVNGGADLSLPITFGWSAVPNATDYNIYAYKTVVVSGRTVETAFVSLMCRYGFAYLEKCMIDTNYYNSGSAYGSSWNGTTIHWRVRAINRTGEGPWSATYSFTLK